MKYKRTTYIPGLPRKEMILSADEVVEHFARVMTYMSCDYIRDNYAFGNIQDDAYPFKIHGCNLIVTTADGEQILQEYRMIEE